MSNEQTTFSQLVEDTDLKIASLAQVQGIVSQDFDSLAEKFEKASEIKDEQERNIRMQVLEAESRKLREAQKQETDDLAHAIFGLNAILEQMGSEYANLQQDTTEGKQLIEDAQNNLKNAEFGFLEAQQKWNIFGRRERAVAQAEKDIAQAKKRLEEAGKEAKRLSRQALLTADMEQSLQDFNYKVEKTIQIMERRLDEIKGQVNAVSTRKSAAFQAKEKAAADLEKYDQELNEAEAGLVREEELVDTFVNGTVEHSQQVEKVSDFRAKVEDLRGKRNTAFTLFQSKEKFAAELEIHERTQMKLRDNQIMWITALNSDTEERVITFRSRLEAMKASSDQEAAKKYDDVGAAIDQNNAEYMAQAGVASDRLRMEKVEKHGDRMADMADASGAQAEAIAKVRMQEAKALEEFRNKYGIDPTKSSFFSYPDEARG